jgi:hypothetical protein
MPDQDWTGAPYARLYSTLRQDHPAVWADDHLLAWYVRLLIPAERAWPIHLEWPRGIPGPVQAALVADGAVDQDGDDYYQVHGLDRLRLAQGARVEAARAGGQARAAQAARGPDGTFRPADIQPDAGSIQRDAGPTLDDPADAGHAGRLNGKDAGGDAGLQPENPAASLRPLPSPPAPGRDTPPGPGRESTPAPARETPAAVLDLPPNATPADVARIQADPRTVQGHPRYVALAGEEADWEAWAAAQPEPSTYPDARPSNQGRFGTANPDCRSPETLEHRRYWRWIGKDRGWVCLYCDRADTRTFRDRMDQASDSPF